MMDSAMQRRVIEAVANAVIAHADELTGLDQAIGDGDHGLNMKRGFEAVLAEAPATAAKPWPEALQHIGMQLVLKVGGASGPLYGTLLMALGKELGKEPGKVPGKGSGSTSGSSPSLADLARAFPVAVEAVKARGKSEPGQKTMLDVLAPVQAALLAGGDDLAKRLPVVAQEAARGTIPMKAIRGRASFLGDRSIGHMDPGARSSALMVAALCQALQGAR
jgi:phosphoenolpyruvate---glycerone phosphotransferase subunit DhaL